MTPVELPVLQPAPPPSRPSAPARDPRWLKTARRARTLSWISLAWMTIEGVVGLIAGLDAGALSVIVWAASSFVEGLASVIVIWRFSGTRTLSQRSERTAQRLVAGSFLLLVPVFVYEAVRRLTDGGEASQSVLGIAVTASAIVLMPALGHAKLRLGRALGSPATRGEGVQNLMCALQATAALIALIAAGAGLEIVDPIAALIVAAMAATESIALWRGGLDDCCAPVGFVDPGEDCRDDGDACPQLTTRAHRSGATQS